MDLQPYPHRSRRWKGGGGQLTDNNHKILSGISALVTGSVRLQSGMKTFDKKGIEELQKLVGGDLQTVLTRLKACRQAEIEYKTEYGDDIGYVIETASID